MVWKFGGRRKLGSKYLSLHIQTFNFLHVNTSQNSTPFTPGLICSGGLTFKESNSVNLITNNLNELNKAILLRVEMSLNFFID